MNQIGIKRITEYMLCFQQTRNQSETNVTRMTRVFPCIQWHAVCFPALKTARLHVFLRLVPVAFFPRLPPVALFSRACHRLQVSPRLALVACFPSLGTSCMFPALSTGCICLRAGTTYISVFQDLTCRLHYLYYRYKEILKYLLNKW